MTLARSTLSALIGFALLAMPVTAAARATTTVSSTHIKSSTATTIQLTFVMRTATTVGPYRGMGLTRMRTRMNASTTRSLTETGLLSST